MKNIRTFACGLAVLGSLALAVPSSAQVMNYQGLLTDTAGTPLDPGQYTVTFKIYDHPTDDEPANLIWGPFRFDGVARPKVNLSGGRFNVVLGPNDAASRSLTGVFSNGSPRFLGIAVGANPEILPRQQILASPTAIHAQRADHATTATAVGNPGQAGAIQILNGNVGIGTSAPTRKLTVQTPVGENYGFEVSEGTVRVGTFIGSGVGQIGTISNHPFEFFVNNGLPKMSIATNGNVGVGTSTPSKKLEVSETGDTTLRVTSTDNSNPTIELFRPGTGNRDWVIRNEGGLSLRIQHAPDIDNEAPTDAVVVDSGGNLSFGPTANHNAVGAQERLRIVRGEVNATGTSSGTGWSATKTGTGQYTMTFSPAFVGSPTITASPVIPDLANRDDNLINLMNVAAGSVKFVTTDGGGADLEDQKFHFIAIGTR